MAMKIEKVVAALPPVLAPNAIYLVRVGAGFDIYVADSTGTTAHTLNSGGLGETVILDGNGPVGTPASLILDGNG